MLKQLQNIYRFVNFADCLLYFVVLFVILVFPNHVKAQIIDTVTVGNTDAYYVQSYQHNSWLYWNVSGGEILSENPTQSDSVIVKWTLSGIGELSVYELSELNCTGQTTEIEILVIENDIEIELDIPNVFSPNNDNKNDLFIIGCNYPPENFAITITNRWGNRVFKTHNINEYWDGKRNGEYCSPGVYYYVIQYQTKEKPATKNGFFHLFR